jgi:hypothetical protein
MKSHKLNNGQALEFIFGGKSIFTFLNTKTENRFTFKVKKHKTDDIFFVQVLTSPDVYQFIGTLKSQSFFYSKKSKISKEAQSVRVFDYVFKNLIQNTLPEFIEIWHQGKCGKCGRTLTVPQSIQSGFGPECSKSKYR